MTKSGAVPYWACVLACVVWLGLSVNQAGLAVFNEDDVIVCYGFPRLSQDGKLIAVVKFIGQSKPGEVRCDITELAVLVFSTATGECIFKDVVDVHEAKFAVGVEWHPIKPDVLLYGAKEKRVWQVDLANHKRCVVIDSLNLPLASLAFSPDAKYLALATWDTEAEDYQLAVIDVGSRKELLHLKNLSIRSEVPPGCSFSDDSKLLAVSDGAYIDVYKLSDPPQRMIKLEPKPDSPDYYVCLAFCPSGKTIAGSRRCGDIQFLDLETGRDLGTVNLSPFGLFSLRFVRKDGKPHLIIYDNQDIVVLDCQGPPRRIWSCSWRERQRDDSEFPWFAVNRSGDMGALLVQSKAALKLWTINLATRKWNTKTVVLRL